MRLLLDTHSWLWMQVCPERFSRAALEILNPPDSELSLWAASAWEIAIKYALGKLQLPVPPAQYVPSRLETSGVVPLLVTHSHASQVATLPTHHRDPLDRLLVAQAQMEKLAILTADRQLESYDVIVRRADSD